MYLALRYGSLVAEANRFFDFLARYAERAVGDESTPLRFAGRYFKCAIVIVARSHRRKLSDITPWVHHPRSLAHDGAEAIYLIGAATLENQSFMDKIASHLCSGYLHTWTTQFKQESPSELVGPDKTVSTVRSYMISLRTTKPTRYERPLPLDGAIQLPPGGGASERQEESQSAP